MRIDRAVTVVGGPAVGDDTEMRALGDYPDGVGVVVMVGPLVLHPDRGITV